MFLYLYKIVMPSFVNMLIFFVQYIDFGYMFTSTHNLCFGAKIRKIGLSLYPTVLLCKSLVHRGPTGVFFFFAPELVGYSAPRDLHRRAAYSICESWFLIHQDVYHDLFVCS